MCALSLKNHKTIKKTFFINMKKKKHLKNIWPNKSFSVFKGATFGLFEHTQTFLGKMFYYYFCHIHEKCLFSLKPFLEILMEKRTCCQQQFL